MAADMPPDPAPAKLSKLGRAALWYATERGWRVFPLHSVSKAGRCSCGKADCGGPGKHPRTANGCLDASTDPDQVRAWWTRWPSANVGIATGQGVVVVDIDPRHGGDDTLVDLRSRLGPLPDTVEVITGSRGRHIYLACANVTVRNSAGVLGPGVDVRGEGGYVVAPPSTHAQGAYAWEASSRPEEVPLGLLPEAWLAAMLRRPSLRVVAGAKGEPFPEGQRNDSLYRRACSMRAAGFDRDAILAAISHENDTRCVPSLDPAEVKAIAESAARLPEGLSPEYAAKVKARPEPAPAPTPTPTVEAATGAGEWEAELFRTAKGAVRNTFANLCAILRRAPEYATLRTNEMTLAPELGARPLRDADVGLMREAIEHRYGIGPGAESIAAAIVTVGSERGYHPVRDYLSGLVWDGMPRIDRVCGRVLRAETSKISQTVVWTWFVSAVARVMQPGCKVDTALVLVGPQGSRKSTFFRVLGGEWFGDSAVDIESKDSFLQLNSAWIYELSELDHVTGRAHAGRIKAFVSSQVDRFRPPFGRAVAAYPRSNVIVGTTNEDSFLNDPTGARRFWCVRTPSRIDTDTLEDWRDQLWAEAAALYRQGNPWWLGDDAEAALRGAAEEFRAADVWEEPVLWWLSERTGDPRPITTRRILTDVIAVRIEDQGQREANRIAAILCAAGWQNRVEKIDGRPHRTWKRGVPP